ncbi:hypothetical protein VTL71DRAFT_286 [Oculimacula yallundae]|uniref:Uncharacterized protein n=1 Tax=Oculimacula yallundae TaxID=86028 RepID=A0ABR4CZR0_9HELO
MGTNANPGAMRLFFSSSFPEPLLSPTFDGMNHPTIANFNKCGLVVRVYGRIPFSKETPPPASFLRADYELIDGVSIALQFRVSATAMIENSGIFKAAYDHKDNGWLKCGAYIDMEYSNAHTLEIVFKAFNDTYINQAKIPRAQLEQIPAILTSLQAPVFKLRYLVFSWLANRDIQELVRDHGSFIWTIFQHFNHGPGMEMMRKPIHMPKAISDYMPMMVPSLRQLSSMIFLGRKVVSSDYASLGFSEPFKHVYGQPLEYWSDLRSLMMAADISDVVPKVKDVGTAWGKLRRQQFLEFAHEVDDKCRGRGLPLIWREDMEGAWVRNAFDLYEKEVFRIDEDFTSNASIREGLQWSLKKIITNRFHPMTKIEKYWAKKAEMQFAQASPGEHVDMDDLFAKMGALQLDAASAVEPKVLTAEEAMIEVARLGMNSMELDLKGSGLNLYGV